MCNFVLFLWGAWSSDGDTCPLPVRCGGSPPNNTGVCPSICPSISPSGLCIYYFLVFNEATVYNNDLYQMIPDDIKLLLLIVMIYPELYDLDLFLLPNPNEKQERLSLGAFNELLPPYASPPLL